MKWHKGSLTYDIQESLKWAIYIIHDINTMIFRLPIADTHHKICERPHMTIPLKNIRFQLDLL